MTAETGLPPGAKGEQKSEEQSSSVRLGLVVLAVLALGGVVEVIVYGYLERPGWIGVVDKKFWDYLDLLIVPAAIAIGVTILNWMQDTRQRKAEDVQKQREWDIEAQRAQDQALQAYLDQLTLLLVTQRDGGLIRLRVDDEVRQVIQARSEPLLRTLNPTRRWSLVLFLAVMGLLARDRPLISLAGADLRGVDGYGAPLEQVDLSRANLGEALLERANVRGSDFLEANLERANLMQANLEGVRLQGANLQNAVLYKANLRGALVSQARLRDADLMRADLTEADLTGAALTGAALTGADLSGVSVTQGQLMQAESLKGATMPDGSKHP